MLLFETGESVEEFFLPRRIVLSKTAPVNSGVLNATLPAFTSSLTAEAIADGTVVGALPAMTASLAGEAVASAELDATLPGLTAVLAADAVAGGELAAELPSMAVGLSAEARATAALQGSLPALDGALAGEAVAAGLLAATLPAMGAALQGTVETTENFSGLLPVLEAQLIGEAINPGLLFGALPAMTTGLTGELTNEGILSAELPEFHMSISGIVDVDLEGELIVTLPMLTMVSGRRLRLMRELERQRRVTREFIAANPSFVALLPHSEERTPSGGVVMVTGVARPVQMLRKIPMSHTERPVDSTSGAMSSDRGVTRKYDMTLLGEWDAVIREGDQWEDLDGQRYVVDAIVPANGYEVKALVMSYGRRPKIHG